MGQSLALVADEYEFQPHLSVVGAEPSQEVEVAETGLSFISGSFGRVNPPSVPDKTQPRPDDVRAAENTIRRWGVGYIAGVGPTEPVAELPRRTFELVGSSAAYDPEYEPKSRELKSSIVACLLAMIFIVLGVGYVAINSSTTAAPSPLTKTAPPLPVNAPASAPNSVTIPPQHVASAEPVVRRYLPATKPAAPLPPAQAPAAVVPPLPSTDSTGDGHHHGSDASFRFSQHHDGGDASSQYNQH